eukprot:g77003.t1
MVGRQLRRHRSAVQLPGWRQARYLLKFSSTQLPFRNGSLKARRGGLDTNHWESRQHSMLSVLLPFVILSLASFGVREMNSPRFHSHGASRAVPQCQPRSTPVPRHNKQFDRCLQSPRFSRIQTVSTTKNLKALVTGLTFGPQKSAAIQKILALYRAHIRFMSLLLCWFVGEAVIPRAHGTIQELSLSEILHFCAFSCNHFTSCALYSEANAAPPLHSPALF